MRATLLLADWAQALNGKLYIMGGGWSVTNPEPGPMAIAIKVEVPWDQANTEHTLQLRLEDSDGEPVPNAEGEPTEIKAEFEVGRPPGLKPGTPLDFSIAINLQRADLPAGSRFTWRLFVNNGTEESWYVSFATRPEKK